MVCAEPWPKVSFPILPHGPVLDAAVRLQEWWVTKILVAPPRASILLFLVPKHDLT